MNGKGVDGQRTVICVHLVFQALASPSLFPCPQHMAIIILSFFDPTLDKEAAGVGERFSLSLSLAFFRSESAGTTRGATPAAPVPVPRRPPPPPPLLPLLQCTLALSSPSLPLLLLLASSSAVRLIGRGSEGKQRQRKFELELRDEGRESVGGSLTGIAFAFASRLLLLQPSPSCLIAGRRPSLQLLSLLSLQLRAACVHTILLI